MIDTFAIYTDLKDSFGDEPARKMTGIIGQIYEELSQSVRREDFNELKEVVRELAEAQKRTEARVEELAEAQQRTEARLDSLTVKLEELAEAQKRTEARVEELAEAQKHTEKELQKLAKGLRETRQMVGGLSDSIGYGLEDRAIAALPVLLRQRFGIEVDAPLVRKYINVDGKEAELNMFGTGHKGNQKWHVVGEGKAKLSKKDVGRFEKLLSRLKIAGLVGDNVIPLLITYSTRPAIQKHAEEKGMHVIWSYELEQLR